MILPVDRSVQHGSTASLAPKPASSPIMNRNTVQRSAEAALPLSVGATGLLERAAG